MTRQQQHQQQQPHGRLDAFDHITGSWIELSSFSRIACRAFVFACTLRIRNLLQLMQFMLHKAPIRSQLPERFLHSEETLTHIRQHILPLHLFTDASMLVMSLFRIS
eukprot:Colp12_sorted_trinity150504_noHs@20438